MEVRPLHPPCFCCPLVLSLEFSPLTPIAFFYVFPIFKVFDGSGFTRTLCGWIVPPSTGRAGCCSAGTYMAQPNLSPFSKATACAICPGGRYSLESDGLSCPYTATTCPSGTVVIQPASCFTPIVPIPDCAYSASSSDRSCGIRRAVDAFIGGSTAGIGPIADWDTSLVTDMSFVFHGKSSLNANISAWNVGAVTDMSWSTYTHLSPLPPRSVLFVCASFFFLSSFLFLVCTVMFDQ
jgi:surface protein